MTPVSNSGTSTVQSNDGGVRGGSVTAVGVGASGAANGSSGFGASGGASAAAGSGGASGFAAGTTGGGTGDGPSNGGTSSGQQLPPDGGPGPLFSAAALSGSLAFTPLFVGEFYGLLPDGGADLSNLDCRISDGLDLWSECGLPTAGLDAGLLASNQILDIYVTSADGTPMNTGSDSVVGTTDGLGGDAGGFATIELSWLQNGQRQVFEAVQGNVVFQATPQGMAGEFTAVFDLDGGPGTLSGSFAANFCASLNGY